jgi:hypothetical protein
MWYFWAIAFEACYLCFKMCNWLVISVNDDSYKLYRIHCYYFSLRMFVSFDKLFFVKYSLKADLDIY